MIKKITKQRIKKVLGFSSVLDPIKDIAKRNELFDSLSDEDKRKEIAWDGLKLVVDKRVKASFQEYWSDEIYHIKGTSKELQQIFNKELPKCRVCQRGLVMLSTIRLGNSIDSNDTDRYDGNEHNIKGFTMQDMDAMEEEFEHSGFEQPYTENSDKKLINICCNIIKNGTFNPKDDTDYLCL